MRVKPVFSELNSEPPKPAAQHPYGGKFIPAVALFLTMHQERI